MQGLIQRVTHASVAIEQQVVAEIKQGIIASPEGQDMDRDNNTDINIGDE